MAPKVAGESPSAEEKAVSAEIAPVFDPDFDKDSDVIVLVENTLYSIPSFLLKQSEMFRSMFTLNPGPEDGIEGVTAERPIKLSQADPSLKTSDFMPFLVALCTPIYKPRKFSADELKSILCLGHKWQFPDLERYAVNQILALTPSLRTHELLELGAKYSIDDLLLPGYVDACCRPALPCDRIHNAITTHLGVQTFLDLLEARRQVGFHLDAVPANRPDANVYEQCFKTPNHCHTIAILKRAFEWICDSEELAKNRNDTSTFFELFEVALKERSAPCAYCSACVPQRMRGFVEEDTVKDMVRGIMKRGTLTKEVVNPSGA